MADWLMSHIIDIVLVLAVIAAVGLAIAGMIKRRKAGKAACGCGCSGCAMADKCRKAEKINE